MRHGRRIKVVELPKADPIEIIYVVQPGVPVDIPALEPDKVETTRGLEKRAPKRTFQVGGKHRNDHI